MAVGPDFMAFTRGAEDAIKANQRDEDRWIKMQDAEVKRQNDERDQAYKEQVQSLGLGTIEDTRATRLANRLSMDVQNTLISGVKSGRFSSTTEAFVALANTKMSDDPTVQALFENNMNTYATTTLLKGAMETGNLKDLALLNNAGYGRKDVLNAQLAIADPAKMDEELLGKGFKQGATPGTYQSAIGDIPMVDAYQLMSNLKNSPAAFRDILTRRANAEALKNSTTDTATKAENNRKAQVQSLAAAGVDPATVLDPVLRADLTTALAEIASRRVTPATGAPTLSPLDEATQMQGTAVNTDMSKVTKGVNPSNLNGPAFVAPATQAAPSQPQFVAPAQQMVRDVKAISADIKELDNLRREAGKTGLLTPEKAARFDEDIKRLIGEKFKAELYFASAANNMSAASKLQAALKKSQSDAAYRQDVEQRLNQRFGR